MDSATVYLLDVKTVSIKKDIFKYFPFGMLISGVFLSEILIVINETFKSNPYSLFLQNSYFNWYEHLDSFTEMHSIGQVVYTQYVLQYVCVYIANP